MNIPNMLMLVGALMMMSLASCKQHADAPVASASHAATDVDFDSLENAGSPKSPGEKTLAFGASMGAVSVYCGRTSPESLGKGISKVRQQLADANRIDRNNFNRVYSAAYRDALARLKQNTAEAQLRCEQTEQMQARLEQLARAAGWWGPEVQIPHPRNG